MEKGKLKELFIGNFIFQLFATLIGGVIILILSKNIKNDYFHWLEPNNFIFWIVLILIFFVTGFIIYLIKRKRVKPAATGYIGPTRGWKELTDKKYFGVNWIIRTPRRNLADEVYLGGKIKPEDLFIKTPPLCPKCKTELKEEKTIFNRYKWKCVRCDLKRKSKKSFYSIVDDVRKIVKSEFREILQERNK